MAKMQLKNDINKASYLSDIVDIFVSALGGEASCSITRAIILCDIAAHEGTTQNEIMQRLDIHKSSLNRHIEWLYDYGCIIRRPHPEDARQICISIYGYSKTHLNSAVQYFNNDYAHMKSFLQRLSDVFKHQKPTLRDAKILAVLNEKDTATRQEIFNDLYDCSSATENRAITNLMLNGLIEQKS